MPRWEEIGRVVGQEAALQLSAAFGGMRIYVPVEPDASLIEAIGADGAAKLSRSWGGEQIDVPARQGKALRITEMLGQGLSTREVAQRLLVTERYVRKVRASMEQNV